MVGSSCIAEDMAFGSDRFTIFRTAAASELPFTELGFLRTSPPTSGYTVDVRLQTSPLLRRDSHGRH